MRWQGLKRFLLSDPVSRIVADPRDDDAGAALPMGEPQTQAKRAW